MLSMSRAYKTGQTGGRTDGHITLTLIHCSSNSAIIWGIKSHY